MIPRDCSAERQVAGSTPQNLPAPVTKTEQGDDLFTAAENDKHRLRMFFESVKGLPCAVCNKPLAMSDGETVFVMGTDLACSQECADKLAADWEAARPIISSPTTPDVWDSPSKRARMPAQFLEIASTAPGSETSARAADAVAPSRLPKAYLIYQWIKGRAMIGATRQELADDLALPLQTICSLVRGLYQCGLIGSNPGHVRLNRMSGLENEVMVHEDHVSRWQPDQQRPPKRPKWMRGS